MATIDREPRRTAARFRALDEPRRWVVLGALLAMLGVVLGAFGAHGVEDRVSEDDFDTYRTAALYHMLHALALFATAFVAERYPGSTTRLAGWCFVAGIVLFSGSLYVLATVGPDILGAITPLGGVAFIAGWALLGYAAWSGTGSTVRD